MIPITPDDRFARMRPWLWLIPALLFMLWSGTYWLNRDAIWWDELWTLRIAGALPDQPAATLGDVLAAQLSVDPYHPPLYYVLVNLWGRVVGWSPFALRTLSLLLGMVTVAVMYRAGAVLYGHRTARYAALLLAGSALFGIYTHELRQYMLYLLFAVLVVWAYQAALRAVTLRRWHVACLMLSVVGFIYAHYFAIFLLIALGVYHLLFVPKHRRWWQVAGIVSVSGVFFLPWLAVALAGFSTLPDDGRLGVMNTSELLVNGVYALGNGILAPLFLCLLVLGASQRRRAYALTLLGGTLGIALVVNVIQPVITHIRYIIIVLPLALLLVARGITVLTHVRRGLAWGVLVLWFVVAGVYTVDTRYADTVHRRVHTLIFKYNLPVDDLAQRMQTTAFADDAVIFYVPEHHWAVIGAYNYYMHGLPARYTMLTPLTQQSGVLADHLRDFVRGTGRVWFAVEQSPLPDPLTAPTQATLAAQYHLCGRETVSAAITLYEYASVPIFCTIDDNAQITYNNGADLLAVDATRDAEQVTIYTQWDTATLPTDVYSVGYYVLDDANQVVAQSDQALALGARAYAQVPVSLADLTAGTYRLALKVYEWQTLAGVTGQDARSGTTSDLHVVETITIE